MKKLTMDDVKRNNRESGQFFFSPDTMKFFKSRIESGLLKEKYFITSEQAEKWSPRLFTIRKYDPTEHDIRTVGGFQEFKTRKDAEDEINGLD